METAKESTAENRLPSIAPTMDAAVLDIIRTETVLSRLPVHNLAKKGSISIHIVKKTSAGEVDLLWKVSPSRDYGEPRQLAYKLDTIIINQRIDEAGRPLPKVLKLGSLNEICTELGSTTDHGTNSKNLKKAFLQNALTGITAKFNYRSNDGTERRLEAAFTRYSVIFTGEKLPDDQKADAVYIIFNEPFWEVLNNAPLRPLNRAYMKGLPPAAQRFYEIISFKIFSALKNEYRHAKLRYSEYCTFSAQVRHYERQPVQDQMAKVLRPHKESGYITSVQYEATIDEQNKPDWIMYLTPGPRAHSEFAVTNRSYKGGAIDFEFATEKDDSQPSHRTGQHQRHLNLISAPEPEAIQKQDLNKDLVAELMKRGIGETEARKVLAKLPPDQPVLDQLEYADSVIRAPHSGIKRPGGFYLSRLLENLSVPPTFETSTKRRAREEAERRQAEEYLERQNLEVAYGEYRQATIDRYIAEQVPPADFAALVKKHAAETRKASQWANSSAEVITMIAERAARAQIVEKTAIPMLSFEEFCARERHAGDQPAAT